MSKLLKTMSKLLKTIQMLASNDYVQGAIVVESIQEITKLLPELEENGIYFYYKGTERTLTIMTEYKRHDSKFKIIPWFEDETKLRGANFDSIIVTAKKLPKELGVNLNLALRLGDNPITIII